MQSQLQIRDLHSHFWCCRHAKNLQNIYNFHQLRLLEAFLAPKALQSVLSLAKEESEDSTIASVMEEYLSSSSIHGLVHIHNAKSGASKAAWVVIVTAGFATAAILISNAYGAWVESPVSTVVTIRPISDLQFPEVTVCPPKGSNTIMNQVLKKITDEEFTRGVREHLKTVIHEKFFSEPSQAFAKSMAPLMNLWSSNDIQGRNIHFPERTANSIHFQVNISDMATYLIRPAQY